MGNSSSRGEIPPGEVPIHTQLNSMASVVTFQGFRSHMEDDYAYVKNGDTYIYAVFDGHSGSGAVKFCKENLLPELLHECQDGFTSQAITRAFINTERNFRTHCANSPKPEVSEFNIRIPKSYDESGTCALVAIVQDTQITIAHVGDCQALIVNNDKTFRTLSRMHRCTNEQEDNGEIERILAANLYVQGKRVNGELAISRSIGDFKYKGDAPEEENHAVTCVPSISTFPINPEMRNLVLFSDGIGDGITVEKIASSIGNVPVEEIVTEAYNESKDNVVFLLITFP